MSGDQQKQSSNYGDPGQQGSEQHKLVSPVSRVNDEFAVGNDLDFEKWWWRVEISIWSLLVILLLTALSGITGRGPLAHKRASTQDQALQIKYDWVERFKTPSVLSIRLEPATFQGNHAYVWLSRSFVDKLGLQRISPEPALSIPQAQGITYLFAIQQSGQPIILDFALEPAQVGLFRQEVRVAGGQQLFVHTLVFP